MSNNAMAELISGLSSGRYAKQTRRVPSGTCAECGCTDERACAGGCSWVNEERTVCTRCLTDLIEARGPRLSAFLNEGSPTLLLAGIWFAKTFESVISQSLQRRANAAKSRMGELVKDARRRPRKS